MQSPTSVTVKHEGNSIELRFTGCKDFAGNVDIDIDSDPSLQTIIEASLRGGSLR